MIKEFLKEEEGQSIIEYSLLMTLIGASMIFILTMLGISISRTVGITEFTVERYAEWAYQKFSSK
jgi:Flp pilus assembly pilin Flp